MARVYFNEFAPFPAQWLRNLHPDADVDDRSIADVGVDDVACYDRVHLFAGISGWEYALQLAGWPDTLPVWTGSCPCQPFSVAGKKRGVKDERHLWPEMYRLVRECRPAVVLGEQVSGTGGLAWVDGVRTDLEAAGYAFGMAVLPAACVNSPHKRERIFWVADLQGAESQRNGTIQGRSKIGPTDGDIAGPLPHGDGVQRSDTVAGATGEAAVGRDHTQRRHRRGASEPQRAGAPGFWDSSTPTLCLDGLWRRVPVEPSLYPLADGVLGRVGQISAFGNAIVPQVAALFITAYMLARGLK